MVPGKNGVRSARIRGCSYIIEVGEWKEGDQYSGFLAADTARKQHH